jgi:hypothetical protein
LAGNGRRHDLISSTTAAARLAAMPASIETPRAPQWGRQLSAPWTDWTDLPLWTVTRTRARARAIRSIRKHPSNPSIRAGAILPGLPVGRHFMQSCRVGRLAHRQRHPDRKGDQERCSGNARVARMGGAALAATPGIGSCRNALPCPRVGFLVEAPHSSIEAFVRFGFIRSDQQDDLTAMWLRCGTRAKRQRCRASFNTPSTAGRTGARIIAAAAAMNLDPLQQPPGPDREILVGLLDHSLPAFVFPLVGSPTHPFRFWRGNVPGAPSFTTKLPVQHCGSWLKAIEAPFALARISEPIGLAAPEMPSAVRQKELCRSSAGSRALKPPAPPAIGRHGPD